MLIGQLPQGRWNVGGALGTEPVTTSTDGQVMNTLTVLMNALNHLLL